MSAAAVGLPLVISTISAATAIGALVVAILSWRASHRASIASEKVAAIEQNRRHSELTPMFEIIIEQPDGWRDRAKMNIKLTGPIGLDSLDEVTVAIRDDGRPAIPEHFPDRAHLIEAHVWGPWRFSPGVERADAQGRKVTFGPLHRGATRPLQIERTQPLADRSAADLDEKTWRLTYAGRPILLQLTCSHPAHGRGWCRWR